MDDRLKIRFKRIRDIQRRTMDYEIKKTYQSIQQHTINLVAFHLKAKGHTIAAQEVEAMRESITAYDVHANQ